MGYSPCSYKESDTTEQLSQHTFAPIKNVLHPVRKQSKVSLRDKNKYCMEVEVKLLSRVQLSATAWTVAHQVPLSTGFSRQEYWSGLPFPSPWDLPDPGIKTGSPALQRDSLQSGPPGKPQLISRQSAKFWDLCCLENYRTWK